MTSPSQADAPDLELHAYSDGEVLASQTATIEARLDVDAAARVLVKALQVQRDALHSHYQLPTDCPKTAALVAQVSLWPAKPPVTG